MPVRGRPRSPYQVAPPGLNYAVVTKRREQGRVVEVGTRVVFGTMAAVTAAITSERLAPAGERAARLMGAGIVGVALFLGARAIAPG